MPPPDRLASTIADLNAVGSFLAKKYRHVKPELPKSLRAEAALFASLLLNPSNLPAVLARLSPDDFSDPRFRATYVAMGEMHRKGLAIDAVTLTAYLDASGVTQTFGHSDLENIPEIAIPAAKVDPYVDLLKHYSVQRRYVELGLSIVDRALSYHPDDPPLDGTLAPLLQTLHPVEQHAPGRLASNALQLSTQTFNGPAWLLDRLFVAGGLNLLAGEVASGKTFLALDLALAVASGGLAWDDRPALHGPVLYFCLDCSPRTLQQRLLALCAGRGILPPTDLHFDFSPLNLADTTGAAAGLPFVRQAVRSTHACLVIFDVLARYMPGVDENSVSSVGPVMTALRGFANDSGCSILILHHYNKGAGYSSHASQGLRVRGSIDIIAAMDAVVAVTVSGPRRFDAPDPLRDARRGEGVRTAPKRILTPEKNRDLPEASGMSFSLTPLPSALRLSFASLKPQSAPSVDLIPAVLQVLCQAPGQPFTSRQIETALNQIGLSFAFRTLQNILPHLSSEPGVSVSSCNNGNTKTYCWDPLQSGPTQSS
jgi:hypothetical protein